MPILLYHSVAEPVRDSCDVLPVHFNRQIWLLQRLGYQALDLPRAAEAHASGTRCVALTFDDGRRDNYTIALPILQARGAGATIFLVAEPILDGKPARSGTPPGTYLTCDQAKALAQAGIHLGAHTLSHPNDLRLLSDAELEREVRGSRERLMQAFGEPFLCFAYPCGRHDARVRAVVQRAGYEMACSVTSGGEGPFDLVRIDPGPSATSLALRLFLWERPGLYRRLKVARSRYSRLTGTLRRSV